MKLLTTVAAYLLVALVFLATPGRIFAGACFDDCVAAGGSTPACTEECRNETPNLPGDVIKPVLAPTNETFDAFNPLKIAGGDTAEDTAASVHADQLSTPGGIVTRVLEFIFPLAGLILFLMISWGGFEVLMGASDSSKVTAGKQRVTSAIVGFLILFASYWMVQIMEVVFGVVIF